jgi:predicted Na+-dependent transporter
MVFSLLPFARMSRGELIKMHPAVLVLLGWQQFVLPALLLSIGHAFDLDRDWQIFLLLTVTSGSLFASPTLVQLMGLEQKMAMQSVVLSTLAAPISIYLSFRFLMGDGINLDFDIFAFRLAIFLVVPIMIFCVARLLTHSWTDTAKDKLDAVGRWGSVVSLVVFCFALESEVTTAISDEPQKVLEYFIVAVAAVIVIGGLTRLVLARFGARIALTGTILTSFRNVGLTFGLVGQFAGPELVIYVGVCQIPMFLSPLLFDLFIGAKRVAAYGNSEEPNAGALGDESEEGSYFGPSKPPAGSAVVPGPVPSPQTATAYYASGNAALAVEQDTVPITAKAETSSEPFEVVLLQHGLIRQNNEVGQEDARALIQRVQDALDDATTGLKQQKEAVRNHAAAHYLAAFALLCIIGVAGVWHSNKYFFPMLFDNDLLDRVATAHVNGENYGVLDLNINIRDLREATIARMPRTPQVVVLGASHWQEAHVNLMPKHDFYNSHVHRDYYEDMLAVTEMWVRHNKLPKEMIITIRDNLLTPIADRTDFLWLPGIKYYRDFADRIGLEPHSYWETLPTQTWRELISLPLLYGQARRQLAADVQPHATSKSHFDGLDVLLPGGSILWSGEHQRQFTQKRARSEALAFARARRNDPPKIDPIGVKHLEALFNYLVAKGVKVTLAHPQFNPVFWEAVEGSPYMVGLAEIEALTKRWSEKFGFPIIGGFSPESVGCTADMYIDAEHGNPKCLGMLLSQYSTPGTASGLRSRISQ